MLLNSHPKYRSAKTSNPDGPRADPKFEIRVPSHLAGADFGYGVPKGPFERPDTGLGGRGHFRGETRSRSCPWSPFSRR